mgnify:CR=1 FL=1
MKNEIQFIGDSNTDFNNNKHITICVFNSVNIIEKHIKIFDKIKDNKNFIKYKRNTEIIKTNNNKCKYKSSDVYYFKMFHGGNIYCLTIGDFYQYIYNVFS